MWLFQNTCKPEGLGGKFMVTTMNLGHAKMAKWGFNQIVLKENFKCLDAGCGGGANIKILLKSCPYGQVKGIDYSKISVEKSKKVNKKEVKTGRCEVLQGNVLSLPYGDNQFNLVTAFETIYFWRDILKCFKEVYRVLGEKGVFLICNEADGEHKEDEKWCRLIKGMTIYNSDKLVEYLKKAGFSEVLVNKKSNGWLCIISKKISGEKLY